jgi:hypothetical protein
MGGSITLSAPMPSVLNRVSRGRLNIRTLCDYWGFVPTVRFHRAGRGLSKSEPLVHMRVRQWCTIAHSGSSAAARPEQKGDDSHHQECGRAALSVTWM